jgi:hypothetical protein
MSNITDFQYIPQGKEEIYYYYRGEGEQSNVIIEVAMNKNGTSKIRYYNYTPAANQKDLENSLPNFGIHPNASSDKNENISVNLNPTLKMKSDDTLPTDINFATTKLKSQVAENFNFELKNEINFNDQSASVALLDKHGSNGVVIEGKNITNGSRSTSVIVPVEINLDGSSDMKIKMRVESQLAINNSVNVKSSNHTESKQSLKLALTDHNHEYLDVKAVIDDHGLPSYQVSNKFSLSKGSSVGAAYNQSQDGTKSFSIQNIANLNQYGTLSTSFGVNGQNAYLQAQYEKKIDQNTSMVITVKTEDQKETTLMYQVQAKY